MTSYATIIDQAIAENKALPGALLPVLHAIQDALGFIPPDAVPQIARELNLSQADVHGVITFYHDFRSEPPGRHVLKLCRAEACQAMGSEALAAHLTRRLGLDARRAATGGGDHTGSAGGAGGSAPRGIEWKQTSPDGALTIEPVYCLGNCALSPAAMLDGKLRGRVTAAALDDLIAACRRQPGGGS